MYYVNIYIQQAIIIITTFVVAKVDYMTYQVRSSEVATPFILRGGSVTRSLETPKFSSLRYPKVENSGFSRLYVLSLRLSVFSKTES